MTFIASSYGFVLGLYKMRDQNFVVDFCMAFDAPDILKMDSLIRKPFMCLDNIYFLPVGQKLEFVKIGMAAKAYIIVVQDCFLDIL